MSREIVGAGRLGEAFGHSNRTGNERDRIQYANGADETTDFELFRPDEIVERARPLGFDAIELCCWWDPNRPPSVDEQRFQVTLERS